MITTKLFRLLAIGVALLSLCGAGLVTPPYIGKRQTSIDTFIATEKPIAKAGLLANIGPDGAKDQGAKSGIVIASPSTSNPDYVYSWTRDSALVFKLVVDQYTGGIDTTLLTTIQNFVASQGRLQQVSNPSGTVSSGGLGEPKFNIDETAFTGGWGRPQRDGPALRAITLITLGNYLQNNGGATYVSGTLWPILKLDLDYVASNWGSTGFDLWEEVNGNSFFTSAAQHRSMIQGAAFATLMGDSTRASSYTTQATSIRCYLQSYWSSSGYIVSNINVNNGRTGLDTNSILTSIHMFDPLTGCDAVTFQPCSDRALANHKAVVDSFRSIYAINSGIASNAAVAVGRYSEDSYYGGNPWYLTTLAAAEQLYDALYQWNRLGSIPVTAVSLPFFRVFLSTAAVGSYSSTSNQYATITAAVKTYADGFVGVVQKYIGSGGVLAEQFTRAAGTPTSAADLTWSYAAALTAFDRRASIVPASWGASGLTVPSTCSGGGTTVSIEFVETATTYLGENIFLVGSISALASWNTGNALALSAATYPQWRVTVSIPASTYFEYKYIRKAPDGTVTWESDPNRSYTSPSSGSVTLNDTWR